MTDLPRKPLKQAGRSLTLIATLLMFSGLVRLGMEAGTAFALEGGSDNSDVVAGSEDQEGFPSSYPEMSEMLKAFQRREARLSKQEIQLELRIKTVEIAEREIEKKLVALAAAEDKLRKTLAYSDSAAENDLARLTSVYESMKPKDAAALFEEMDPDFAAGFLGRMRPDAAAGIMAGLSPQAAYSVSVRLAGRNANAPTQ